MTKPRANSSRQYLDDFARAAAAAVPRGARVLDAGAGHCPYRAHFQHAEYESADFCQVDKQYAAITHVCDLARIPVEDARFDLVFCSQTLEHVPEPAAVLKEFHRVLKPGGQLWLSAPLFYAEHEAPYDFYRYTQYGFRHLVEASGLRVVRLEWLEGYCGTLAYQLALAARALPVRARHYGGGVPGLAVAAGAFLLKPCFGVLARLFTRLDARHKFTGAGHCKNYALVAVKPDA